MNGSRPCYTLCMFRDVRSFRLPLLLAFCALRTATLWSEGLLTSLEYSFRASILVIPEDNGLESDPMPVLAAPGVATAYPLSDMLAFALSLDMYGTYYGYSQSLERAVPYALENRSSFVLGSLLGVHGIYSLPLPLSSALRLYAGASADIRICLVADGLEGADLEDASEQTGEIARYFWSDGRWFFPLIGAGFDLPVHGAMRLGMDLRTWIPLYKLWTAEELPPVEGWRVALGLRVTLP